MAKGKTEFRFTVNGAPETIEQAFTDYLAANEFMRKEKANANYYLFNDPIVKGKRSLEYYINGNEVMVLAYMRTFEKPLPLEGMVGALAAMSYRNDLMPLFEALEHLGGGPVPMRHRKLI